MKFVNFQKNDCQISHHCYLISFKIWCWKTSKTVEQIPNVGNSHVNIQP